MADLVQISSELSMCQTMFNPNTNGPSDEHFMAGKKDLVLQHAPSASFGSLLAILAPYVGHHINDHNSGKAGSGGDSLAAERSLGSVSSPLSLRQKATPCG